MVEAGEEEPDTPWAGAGCVAWGEAGEQVLLGLAGRERLWAHKGRKVAVRS